MGLNLQCLSHPEWNHWGWKKPPRASSPSWGWSPAQITEAHLQGRGVQPSLSIPWQCLAPLPWRNSSCCPSWASPGRIWGQSLCPLVPLLFPGCSRISVHKFTIFKGNSYFFSSRGSSCPTAELCNNNSLSLPALFLSLLSRILFLAHGCPGSALLFSLPVLPGELLLFFSFLFYQAVSWCCAFVGKENVGNAAVGFFWVEKMIFLQAWTWRP